MMGRTPGAACPEDPMKGGGGVFRAHRVEVEDGVSLRALEWSGEAQIEAPLLLIAGWITIVDSWVPVLERLAKTRRVIYLESREKPSGEIRTDKMCRSSFKVPCLGRDVLTVASAVGVDPGQAVLAGSSLGANAILEALKQGFRCKAAFLIGPNAEFAFPLWSRAAIHLPSRSYRSLVPFILWYLRRFRLDARAEPEQYERYRRTLESADFARLKLSALALVGYRVIEDFDGILDPVGVAFAASDRLHGDANARRLAHALPNGSVIPCPTNAFMHQPEVVGEIDRYVRMVS